MSILFKEIEQAYLHDRNHSRTEASYPQYARYLETDSSGIDFWKKHLKGVQPCQFPTLVSQHPIPNEWETTSVDLDTPYERLEAFAGEHRIDLSVILQVAWGLLLRTYIGADRVCFGCRIAGRNFPVDPTLSAAIIPALQYLPSRSRSGEIGRRSGFKIRRP